MFGLLSAREKEVWKTELLPPSEVTTGNKNAIEPAFYHLGEWAAESYISSLNGPSAENRDGKCNGTQALTLRSGADSLTERHSRITDGQKGLL